MRVTVLGCGSAYPRPGGACTGYLVDGGGVRVWLDAGNGTFSNLQKHLSHRDVDALVLSHVHADHIADVIPFMYALGFDPDFQGSVPVWAPADVAPAIGHLLGESSRAIFDRVFDIRRHGAPFEVGGLRFEPFPTVHPVQTYGVRVVCDGKTFVFTADTAWFPALGHSCADADLIVCEATYDRGIKAEPGVHLWAHEAGEAARQAHAKCLVLTHIWPTVDPAVAVTEASGPYDGPVEAAAEGRVFDV